MFYTLLKFLVWGLLLAFVGGVIGWVLRSLKARSQVAWGAGVDVDEVDEMRYRLANFEAVVAERDRLRMQVAHMRHADSPGVVGTNGTDSNGRSASDLLGDSPNGDDSDALRNEMIERRAVARLEVDLGVAEAVLGRRVRLDDLTAIDGIGPKIAELCAGIGVSTWAQLARTEQAELRSMLDDAGSPYRMRDPSSWPRQAAMLASGRWDDFKLLTAEDR